MARFVARRDNSDAVRRFLTREGQVIASTLRDREAKAAIRKELRRGVATARAVSLSTNREGYSGSVGTVLSSKGTTYPVLRIGVRSRIARSFGGRQVVTRGRVRRGQALGMEYGNARLEKREPLQRGFNEQRRRAILEELERQAVRVTGKRVNTSSLVIKT